MIARREIVDLLNELNDWDQQMGNWEAKCWRTLRRLRYRIVSGEGIESPEGEPDA